MVNSRDHSLSGHTRNSAGFRYYSLISGPEDTLLTALKEECDLPEEYRGYLLPMSERFLLAGFQAQEAAEETMIRWLQRIAGSLPECLVTLNNYGGFPPDGIYLRVMNPAPFLDIAQKLDPISQFITSNGWPPPHFDQRPHITIAKGLPAHLYEKLIPRFSQRSFFAQTVIREWILIRREHALDAGRQLALFRLQPASCSHTISIKRY
jgi:hypothetical protein